MNYTKVPNPILEVMPFMKPVEARITALFLRLSFGYHRNEFRITQAEIMQQANLKSKSSLISGLRDVEKRGFFKKGTLQSQYILCTDLGLKSVPLEDGVGTKNVPQSGLKSVPQKGTLFVHKGGLKSVPPTIIVKNKEEKERKNPHPHTYKIL